MSKKVKYPRKNKRLYAVGEGSLLDLFTKNLIWLGSFCVGLHLEKRCKWNKGRTFRINGGVKEIADAIGYSVRHVYRCLKQLEEVGWFRSVAPEGAGYLQYEIYPFDAKARQARQTTAAPLDASCPLEQLGAGKITSTECAIWHFANVDWQVRLGETLPRSIREWASLTGISARKVWEVLKTSTLFQRASASTYKTVVKVFPFLDEETDVSDRHELSESEIQASHFEVIFRGDTDIAMYCGEQYRQSGIGFEYWKAETQRWIFTVRGIPEAVKAAFGERAVAGLSSVQ